ncbi:MAG: peptidoglycan DD-metalloendopeptidase family protein [Actinobacteria bacterium]|nr:peptidoglycan DD-metalloendopeptidase family protein [Actinomycetota bacterium]
MVQRPALLPIAAAFALVVLVGILTAAPVAAQPGPGGRDPATGVDRTEAAPVAYQAPVDTPVIDGFRPPARPWLPGNRGYEYATFPGQVVRAAADGSVLFAGTVAGSRHVTLLHADGLRTSYSFLSSIEVTHGREVLAGTAVGRAATTFHFGVRDPDGTYLDPGLIFGSNGTLRARLAPHDEEAIVAAARELLGDERSTLGNLVAAAGSATSWVGEQFVEGAAFGRQVVASAGRTAIDGLTWYVERPIAAVGASIDLATDLLAALPTPECTPSEVGVESPRGDRVAILVPGLDSGSDGGPITDLDMQALGIDPDDVVRFSYGGGRIAGDGPGPEWATQLEASHEAAGDVHRPVDESAELLAQLLSDIAGERPGATLEVYGHSLGGLVALEGVARLAADADAPHLRLVTLSTPHGGNLLAEGFDVLGALKVVAEAFRLGGRPEVGQPVLADLAVGALRPVPSGVEALSLAASGDLFVPAGRAELDGARTVVVDVLGTDAHGGLVGHRDALREISLFLADRPSACQSLAERLGGVAVPFIVESAHQLVTASGFLGYLG